MQIKKTIILLLCVVLTAIFASTNALAKEETVEKKAAHAGDYILVQEEPDDWTGTYLFVYENSNDAYAFNAGLESPYTLGNYISVDVTDGLIAGSDGLDDFAVMIERIDGTDNYTILLASGKYMGNTGSSPGISATSTHYPNAISLDNEGFAIISNITNIPNRNTYFFRFNPNQSSNRFSYFSASTGRSVKLYRRNGCIQHIYNDGEITSEADCYTDGVMAFTCLVCGNTYEEVIPAGHMPILISAVEATCTQTGLTAGTRCAICDEILSPQKVIPAKGHEEEPEEELDATCTEPGSYGGSFCAVCGETIEPKTVISPLGHDFYYTPEQNDSHWKSCSRCDEETLENCSFENGLCVCGNVQELSNRLRISSVSLNLDEDIDLIYRAEVPDGCTDVYMSFTMNGKTKTVADDGSHIFVYEGVCPQTMADNICAVLSATCNGTNYSDILETYSVRQYCINTLNKFPDDERLSTLISDLLTYGAAAQEYTNYKTDMLVTAGLTLSPTQFVQAMAIPVSFTGESSVAADWNSAALVLNNSLTIRLNFTAVSVDELSVKAQINGRLKVFDKDDFVALGNGKYYLDYCGIKAAEFADVLSAEFYSGKEKIGRTLNYTVNTYICGVQNNETNPKLKALVRALYNYGTSASEYERRSS